MAYDLITKYTSPNSSPRSYYGHIGPPTGITIHWWGSKGQRFENVVSWLCNPAAGTSAHYVVEAGRVACIVSPELAGWHSGSTIGNGSTIGIECRPEATDGDYETVAELIRDLRETYGNLPLYPHNQWAATACPGDWNLDRLDRLARQVKPAAAKAPKPIDLDPLEKIMALSKAERTELLKDIGEAVWDERMSSGDDPHFQARTHMLRVHRTAQRLEAQNTALIKAVSELANNPAITAEALEAMLDKAVSDFKVTLAPEVP